MHKLLLLIVTLYFFYTQALTAQNNHVQADSLISGEIVSVIPGPEYEAGWWHELFFGKHWRSLWITPIDVQILDLNSFAGGLSVLKRGGGFDNISGSDFPGQGGELTRFLQCFGNSVFQEFDISGSRHQ